MEQNINFPVPPPAPPVEPLLKIKLLIYLLVSVVGFSSLVLTPRAGVSVPIFVFIQAVGLYIIAPRKRIVFALLPVFILALNSFISANPMWRLPNLIVAIVLYGFIAVYSVHGFSFKDTSWVVFFRLGNMIIRSFKWFAVPFAWGAETEIKNMPMIRRVLIGVAVTIPVLAFLITMLASADMIFGELVYDFFDQLLGLLSFSTFMRILFGVHFGLYMFGVLYNICTDKGIEKPRSNGIRISGDCVVLGIVLTSALLVYTLFVAIQFRYLFASPNNLPYGLTFVTYARRGFFELLFLTGVNIASILVTVWMTKTQNSRGAKFIKGLCLYLCTVTVVLLVSSFYRMWLYGSDDGLTRMRLLVFGFLFFEGIGLIFTFFYIAKPKFNIVLVYFFIALSYFLVLNIVPIDRVIANDQVNRYLAGRRYCAQYALSLSPDAAPEIARLFNSTNEQTRQNAYAYFNAIESHTNWRQWNLARSRAQYLKPVPNTD